MLLVHAFWFETFTVPSRSMEPNYGAGDRIVVDKRAEFARGDVVVFSGEGSLYQPAERGGVLAVIDTGGQAALLAPTEVLAAQHHRSISALLGDLAEAESFVQSYAYGALVLDRTLPDGPLAVEVDDLARALGAASVLLFTPVGDEPFGRAAVEAIAARTAAHLDCEPSDVFVASTGAYTKMGLDNPDTLYYHADVEPTGTYRVRGRRGTTTDLSFQVLRGDYTASSVPGGEDAFDDRRLTILTDDERAVVHYGGRPLVPGDEG